MRREASASNVTAETAANEQPGILARNCATGSDHFRGVGFRHVPAYCIRPIDAALAAYLGFGSPSHCRSGLNGDHELSEKVLNSSPLGAPHKNQQSFQQSGGYRGCGMYLALNLGDFARTP